MTPEKACALAPGIAPAFARKHAKPFAPPEAHCPANGEDMFCDQIDVAPKGADACFVSNDHIRAAEKRAASISITPEKPGTPWDGKKIPKYLERIDDHLHLTPDEKTRLQQNGFVVLDRLPYSNYAHAFHDVFQEELPLYVGADPILQAVFRATDAALEVAEKKRLVPALDKMLGKLLKHLAQNPNLYDEITRKDLDLYVGLARRLSKTWSSDTNSYSVLGQDKPIESVYEIITKSSGLVPVEIFGRTRMIDSSQYTPRGHYANMDPRIDFEAYFCGMTWLTRFEWNLVSRDCRSSHPDAAPDKRETPREARDALALADLFRQSGALTELTAFEEVYSAFGGKREDVGIRSLLDIMDHHNLRPNDPEAPEKLAQAIGNQFRRTARTHFMPQSVKDLPVISTVIGARISADLSPLENLVHDAVPNRFDLNAADVGFVLGHDRAKTYLLDQIPKYPGLEPALNAARQSLAQRATADSSIQGTYLQTIVSLSQTPIGQTPSFMQKEAYADFRLSSALVAYGQLRHTFVLLSGQGYDAYGCAIPEAYVEPLAPLYAALLQHVKRLQAVSGGNFAGLFRVLTTLSNITKTELGRGLPTKDQSQWLGMVAEYVPQGGYADSGEPPKWTGWYFDMFEDRELGATKAADFIADYFTLTNVNQVAYIGADGPRLGVFVVDSAGEPRAFVGPVAHGYELKSPLAERLDDAAARTAPNKQSLFRDTFAVKPRPEPRLGLGLTIYACYPDGKLEMRVVAASDKPVGPVSITLRDHHADPLAPPLTREIQDELVVFPFRFPDVSEEKPTSSRKPDEEYSTRRKVRYLVEAMHLRIEDLALSGQGSGPYDWFTSPSVFWGKDDESLPRRETGAVNAFIIGGP